MERAVIVQPHESYFKRFAIEASRIQNKHPPQKIHKHCFQTKGSLVLQMTGPVSGGDGKYYILIEYEWNKELWWVPAEDVKEVVPAGGRNKTAPNRFRPGEKNESNHRWDQSKKLIHTSDTRVIDRPLTIKELNEAMKTSWHALEHPSRGFWSFVFGNTWRTKLNFRKFFTKYSRTKSNQRKWFIEAIYWEVGQPFLNLWCTTWVDNRQNSIFTSSATK